MKKLTFIILVFLVAGVLLYLLMRGAGDPPPPPPPSPKDSSALVLMVDSVKIADWQNTDQFKQVRSSILLSESNAIINEAEKERLLNSLDISYAFSLNKKYNAIKLSFTAFPTVLYNEMIAFQSKDNKLKTGIGELKAYRNLERMEGTVNQMLKGRFSSAKWTQLLNQINDLNLGALSAHSKVRSMRANYNSTLNKFKYDVEYVTSLIDLAEGGADFFDYQDIREYVAPAGSSATVNKYLFYKTWFNNPDNSHYFN